MRICKKTLLLLVLSLAILMNTMPVFADKKDGKGGGLTSQEESSEETQTEVSETPAVTEEESTPSEEVSEDSEEVSSEVIEEVIEEVVVKEPEFELTYVPADSIVQLFTGYLMDDGTMDAWICGTGVLVDGAIVTAQRNLFFQSAEDERYTALVTSRAAAYQTLRNLDLHDYYTVSNITKTYAVFSDGSKEVVSVYSSDLNGYAVLCGNLSEKTMIDVTYDVGEKAAIVGFTEEQLQGNVSAIASGNRPVVDAPTVETITVSDNVIPAGVNAGYMGAAVLDAEGNLIGVVLNELGDIITVRDIESLVPSTNNATTESETITGSETEDKALEKAREQLQQAMILTQGINRSAYTAESLEELDSTVEYATLLYDSDASEDELLKAASAVREAKANLVAEKEAPSLLNKLAIFTITLCGIGLLGVIFAAVFRISSRREKVTRKVKKDTVTSEKPTKKEAKPGKMTNLLGLKTRDFDSEAKAKGYGGVSFKGDLAPKTEPGLTTVGNIGSDETTFLTPMSSFEVKLTRVSNGADIMVTKNEFVLGKEMAKVDYCLTGNSTISRRHCAIRWDGADIGVEDLGSLNGTFVNDIQVQKGSTFKLNDGDKLKLSDEVLIFHQKLL